MRYLDRVLKNILVFLDEQFAGLPLERIRKEARELLEVELFGVDLTLELFLERLAVCRCCGNAWPKRNIVEAVDEDGPNHLCESCSGEVPHGR